MIDSDQDFSRYKLLVLPMLFMFKPGVVERLRSFVEAGGTLVATYFTGYVDECNNCSAGGNPGGEAGRRLFGLWSEDFDGLEPAARQSIVWNGKRYSVSDYAEILRLEGAEVEAVYGDDFYAGTPAVARRKLGTGRVIYIGARTGMDFLNDFYGALLDDAGIEPVLSGLPESVRAARRRAVDGGEYYFLYNLKTEDQTVKLPQMMEAVWEKGGNVDAVTLSPNSATVLFSRASDGER